MRMRSDHSTRRMSIHSTEVSGVNIIRFVLASITAVVGLVLAAPIIILGLPIAVVAILTRVTARLLEPGFACWGELIEFDPELGWKPKANLNTHHLADDVFHVRTDSNGWKGNAALADSAVVVFGDSFAWGYGIDDKDFFANLNGELKVKAVGANGYNMVQELMWMQRLSSMLKGKLVVWLIYYGNDLYENLTPHMCNYRAPFIREVDGSGDWEVVTNHISPSQWPSDLVRQGRIYYEKLSELCTPSFMSERAYSACEFLLRKGQEVCIQAGARLVVMTIPEVTQLSQDGLNRLSSLAPDPKVFDPDLPDQSIKQICANLDVPFVALKDHLDAGDYKNNDCHWNRRGHRRVSDLLSTLYREYMLTSKHTDAVPDIRICPTVLDADK